MRKARVVITLATVIGLCGPVLTANNKYGMNTHYLDSNLAAKMNELGAGFVRLDFNWNDIERDCKGCFNWGATDAYVAQAQGSGLSIFATLAYTPGWANGGAGGNVPPSNYNDWYDFVRAVAQRYNGSLLYYGVWNEPNLGQFLAGTRSEQLAAYRELALRANDALNSVNSGLKVVGPEVSHHGIDDGFYRTVMQDYGHSVFDIVSVHMYDWGSNIAIRMNGEVRDYSYSKEIWLTEVGYSSCSSGEEGQEIYYEDVLVSAWIQRAPQWTKIFFYHLFDGSSCSHAIVRSNWTNRPAFNTYKDYIAWYP